jgi:hypothetical protein
MVIGAASSRTVLIRAGVGVANVFEEMLKVDLGLAHASHPNAEVLKRTSTSSRRTDDRRRR